MKITKKGDLERVKRITDTTGLFRCGFCGCEFEAESSEYESHKRETSIQMYRGVVFDEYYSCKCPTCGNVAYTYKTKGKQALLCEAQTAGEMAWEH